MSFTKSFFALSVFAVSAFASQISFNALPAVNENGTYNGFVGATIDGVDTQIVCDDYTHVTYIPSGPLGYTESFVPNLGAGRFHPGADFNYRVAALLVFGDGNTLTGLENTPTSQNDDVSAIQYALWGDFSPSTPVWLNSSTLLSTAQNDVLSGVDYSTVYSQLAIYTPADAFATNQEFLGKVPTTAVVASAPEPGTVFFALTGFLLMLASRRKWLERLSRAN